MVLNNSLKKMKTTNISHTFVARVVSIIALLLGSVCSIFAENSAIAVQDNLKYCIYGLDENNDHEPYAYWVGFDKNPESKTVVLPDFVDYKGAKIPVTVISTVFDSRTQEIETLVCGQNIRKFDTSAFDCAKIKKITFPDKAVRVPVTTFHGCQNLDTLVFNSDTTYIVSDFMIQLDYVKHIEFKGSAVFMDNCVFYADYYPDLDKMYTEITWPLRLPIAKPAKERASATNNNSETDKTLTIDWGNGKHVLTIGGLRCIPNKKIVINGNTRFNSIDKYVGDAIETIEFEKRIPWDKEPENTIDKNFFSANNYLKTVICHDTEPWPVSDFTITQDMIDRGLTLYVPQRAIETYKCHPAWGKFPTILPIENAVNDIETNNSEAPVEYFNLQGVRIDNPTPGTLVIRRQGTNVDKVIL